MGGWDRSGRCWREDPDSTAGEGRGRVVMEPSSPHPQWTVASSLRRKYPRRSFWPSWSFIARCEAPPLTSPGCLTPSLRWRNTR